MVPFVPHMSMAVVSKEDDDGVVGEPGVVQQATKEVTDVETIPQTPGGVQDETRT